MGNDIIGSGSVEIRYSKRAEIAKRFVSDDIASADDLAAIKPAREDLANGETVSHDDIDWD